MKHKLGYRQNVGAILRRFDNLILMCERLRPQGTWQFPQGGVDHGESTEFALWRELGEELGFEAPESVCSLVACGPETNYDFAPDYDAPIARKYQGQRQTLFLLDFHGCDDDFRLDWHDEPEFQDFRWVTPAESLELMWGFKRPVLDATFEALAAELEAGYRAIRSSS